MPPLWQKTCDHRQVCHWRETARGATVDPVLIVDCPDHGSRVLLSERRIRRLHNADAEIILDVDCWCGARLRIHTGRRDGVVARCLAG
jgi:hypothetical protein